MANAGELCCTLAKGKVVLMLQGHTHLQWSNRHPYNYYRWGAYHCVILGHCRNHGIDPAHGRIFAVIHITDGRIIVAPRRWDMADWAGYREHEQADCLVLDIAH